MKRIWRERDKEGGGLEIQVLRSNNEIPEDLIWLHVRRGKGKKNEVGFTMKPWEAHSIIRGLFLAIDYIYDKYGLEHFRFKKEGGKE